MTSASTTPISRLPLPVFCLALALLDALGDAQAANKCKQFTSNYAGASVFYDRNRNGMPDSREKSRTTDARGCFATPKGKGILTLIGGNEISTGQPNTLVLTATNGTKAIGVLTALAHALEKRGQKPKAIQKLLFLPSKNALADYAAVPINKTQNKRNQTTLVKKNTQQATLALFAKSLAGARLGIRASLGDNSAGAALAASPGEDAVIGALAQALIDLKPTQDLGSVATVRDLLNNALGQLGVAIASENLELVAEVAGSRINARIEDVTPAQPDALTSLEQDRAVGAEFLVRGDFIGFRQYFFPQFTGFTPHTGLDPKADVTNNKQPILTGIAPANTARLLIYSNTSLLGQTTPDSSGAWTFTCPPLQPDGIKNLYVVTSETSDPTAAAKHSPPLVIEVDTQAPNFPTVKRSNFLSTENPQLEGTWTSIDGETLVVKVNGKLYSDDNGLTLSAGVWSLRLNGLAPGSYDIEVTETDRAGNSSTALARSALTIELPPQPPSPSPSVSPSPSPSISPTPAPTLNDSGITRCSDDVFTNLSCPVTGYPSQDAEFGRDRTNNDNRDGHAGFSYTKIGADGTALAVTAKSWGCLKDNVTGLIWEVKTKDGGLRDMSKTYTNYSETYNPQLLYQDASDASGYRNAVNSQGLCGAKDWRLPTVEELQTLVDASVASPGPTLDSTFLVNTPGKEHWTSTPHSEVAQKAWVVDFDSGFVDFENNLRDTPYAVRLVRAGKASPPTFFQISTDGLEVTDLRTRLVWRRCAEGMSWDGTICSGDRTMYTWQQALQQAAAESVRTGLPWRLPNRNELASLVVYSVPNPDAKIDASAFPNTPTVGFWSSSPSASGSGLAWRVHFNTAKTNELSRTSIFSARLVRDAP